MTVLPPNVSAEDFASAIKEFSDAVDADWMFTRDEDIELYRDPYSMVKGSEQERLASGAVAPASVEQVQKIVRIANKYKIPLYPISTGRNFGYGGPAPNLHGSVIVDLKRMDKILEVNQDRNFALVEPGVSYFDLYRYIQDRGLKVLIDCPDVGWGGPVGNALDRGMGYTMPFYRDHANACFGMEVVLANGEVMRTGMGALPGAETWQEYKHGYGPDPSGLFPQGNFGIVTKMGFRLMPQPEYYRTGMVTVPKRRDLIQMIKVVNYLSDSHLIGEAFYGSPLRALMQDSSFAAAVSRPGGADEAELDRFAADNNLHAWNVELQFYGPEKTCQANWEYARERFEREIPGARSYEGESLKVPLTEEQLENKSSPYTPNIWHRKANLGVPELSIWGRMGRSEEAPEGRINAHFGFFPVIPRTGEAVFESQRVFTGVMDEFDLPNPAAALQTPTVWAMFAYQMRFNSTTENREVMHKALRKMIRVAADHGWGDYRAPTIDQDHVSNTYSWGNFALLRFNEALKDAVDPNGILAPGRGGVWPNAHRANRAKIGKNV